MNVVHSATGRSPANLFKSRSFVPKWRMLRFSRVMIYGLLHALLCTIRQWLGALLDCWSVRRTWQLYCKVFITNRGDVVSDSEMTNNQVTVCRAVADEHEFICNEGILDDVIGQLFKEMSSPVSHSSERSDYVTNMLVREAFRLTLPPQHRTSGFCRAFTDN
ncbi:hypothetical protein T265_01201 [Opisthorchis viverrini]|uniref:Uncharacterized protein n=1 Tax=Opisthorchis viverrini TaxID=6198 RepID=A0A075AAD5_OPIVI|nr:hypothetical protein T265_01201 [Opisthorchis viverrini]KER32710.1 hypothetical protein T265_01201 [Opisthorchis viverrini]